MPGVSAETPGWLNGSHLDTWRRGRASSLHELLPVRDDKLTQLFEYLERWARVSGLEPTEADYVSATRDRRSLRFTSGADPGAERAWRTRWIPG